MVLSILMVNESRYATTYGRQDEQQEQAESLSHAESQAAVPTGANRGRLARDLICPKHEPNNATVGASTGRPLRTPSPSRLRQ